MTDAEERFRFVIGQREVSIRDINLDAFADGVIAHRFGHGFHENPHGGADTPTVERLSWTMGWNERALQEGEPLGPLP
jgi:hypothetical protein